MILLRFLCLLILAAAGVCCSTATTALAGPPLVVDDTDTLNWRQVELFTGFLFTKQGVTRTYETPTELTIGLAPGWECSANGSWQYITDNTATPETVLNGVFSLEVGTKYRLLTESATMPLSVALSAKLRFPTSSNAKYANQGKVSGGGILVLGRVLGDFTLNANVGYRIAGAQNRDKVSNAWFFGLAAQRLFAKKYTVFAETYATPQVDQFRSAVINADGGLLWDLSDRYRISFLVGRGFRSGGAEIYANLGFLFSLGAAKPAN